MLELLGDESNVLFLSRATFWELAIKVARGKLDLPGSSVRSLIEQVDRAGITVLDIEDAHILRTESFPHHHGDPFDRMIIAQALVEQLTILSSDSDFPQYGAPVIWT